MRTALRLLLCASLVPVAGCIADTSEDAESNAESDDPICATGPTIRGVDVSIYQGHIDWKTAHAHNVKFGIARISDGTGNTDPTFNRNWSEMKKNDVVRGSYQFFRPGESPIAQANLVIAALKKVGGLKAGDIPPVLDAEVTDGMSDKTVIARMHTWLSHIEQSLDRVPIIYTSPGFWSSLGSPKSFSHDNVWVAHWGVACPTLPAGGFKTFKFWQYADDGSVPGIPGRVDLDRFNGSFADLQKFAGAELGGVDKLGGALATRPVIARNADGMLEVFGADADGKVATIVEKSVGEFGTWKSIGSDIEGAPVVTSDPDGRLRVFGRTATGTIVTSLESATTDGAFSAWHSIGGDVVEAPVAARDPQGLVHVAAINDAGDVRHRARKPDGTWTPWNTISDVQGGLTALSIGHSNNGLIIAARGASDGELYVIEEHAGTFGPAISLGGSIQGAPSVVRDGDGYLHVFARGSDGALHTIHTRPLPGWSLWQSLGGDVYSPVATTNHDGSIEVFARDGQSELVHFTEKSNGKLTGAHALGQKILGVPAAGREKDGRLVVFAKVAGGHVISIGQKKPGAW
jgi:GH25 family lysozyme M1 (1,4-beta-N-acetylmuramidase)